MKNKLNYLEKLIYNYYFNRIKLDKIELCEVPVKYRDYNLCYEAVKSSGFALEYVPEELKDYNMCLDAVKQHGHLLVLVPEEYRDYDMCLEALYESIDLLNKLVFNNIPEKIKNKLEKDGCLKIHNN